MKRHGHLFEKIIDIENIRKAHHEASKDKGFYKEVREINKNPDPYFYKIRDMLLYRAYEIAPSDYTQTEKVDKGKVRIIQKLDYFPHRIIQWALMLQVHDVFFKGLIRNTFSSLPGRGIHDAARRLHRDMQDKEATIYCLKIDVKQFYPSINHEVSSQQIQRKIKDPHVIWLCNVFIYGMLGGKGAPIGSLFSQWQGNINLSAFDHWIKETKRMQFYYRYCDDCVLLHHDKRHLQDLLKEIRTYLSGKLSLEVKENYQIFPSRVRGIDFVGYRFFGDYILLRKSTAQNLRRSMGKLLNRCRKGIVMTYGEWCSINSYNGWLIFCSGYNLSAKYIKPLLPYAKQYYKDVIRNEGQRHTAA